MAMTETRPDEAEAAAPAVADGNAAPRPTGGLAGVLGSGDHHVIGRLWIATSLLFLVGAGVIGALLGAERFQTTTNDVFNDKHFAQAFSIHAVAGFFLFAIPLLIGIATVVVPRQLGASTVAFPRAATLAYWTYLVGGGLVVLSYLIDGGPGGHRQVGVDLFLASLALVSVAIVLASVCLATTVLALRPAGMKLERAPIFSWSVLVATSVWIVSFGFLIGELVLLYLDSRYRVGGFLLSSIDIDRWLYWTTTQPQVYAAAIPVLGFVAEVVPVAAGVRQRRPGVVLGAIGAFGALSFGAWTFAQGAHPEITRQFLFVATSFAALLPILIVLGAVGESLAKGTPKLSSPLLFGVAGLLMLGAGVLAGALRAAHPFELVGTTADASVAHYALGAVTIAGIGALHYWWPQILGRPLSEGIGRLTALLALLGTVLLALPDLVSGFLDEPRGSRVPIRDGVQLMNVLSFVGGALLLVAVLVFIANLAASLGKRGDVPDGTDPWDGYTLEWAADPAMVPVTSAAPLLDQKESAA